MSYARPRPLTTFDWISRADSELRTLGAEPAQRFALTGHRRPLHEEWVRSVGCWGRFDARELINDRAPNEARLHVSSSSYRQFKSRWKLKSRKQWTMCFGSAPWSLATECAEKHARAARLFQESCGIVPPIGVACAFAVSESLHARSHARLGLLPIEATLYTRSLHMFLIQLGLGLEDWLSLDAYDRDEVWARGGWLDVPELLLHPASPQLDESVECRAA